MVMSFVSASQTKLVSGGGAGCAAAVTGAAGTGFWACADPAAIAAIVMTFARIESVVFVGIGRDSSTIRSSAKIYPPKVLRSASGVKWPQSASIWVLWGCLRSASLLLSTHREWHRTD